MLASSLIRSFVSTPAFLRAYCDSYGGDPAALPAAGPPPSRGHAENMGRTLQEWAGRLDAAGVQVHQEGAIARFESAAQADDYGRPPPAAAARKKTSSFYAEVLRRAVALRGANSFTIPASAYQGAVVATHEAGASAAEFFAAEKAARDFSADPSRPELMAEAEKLKGTLGRAASMHQTACSEAVASWRIAEGGSWFRQISDRPFDPASMPNGGHLIVGVEVWAGHPALAHCHASLDPQHGGGIYGFGRQPATGCIAACDAAMSLREQGLVLPESARYVTARTDPDSFVAAMILSGRVPLPLFQGSGHAREKIRRLAERDAAIPREGGWKPEFRPQTVGDDGIWGPVGALMIPRNGVPPTPLEELEAAVLAVLTGAEGSALFEAAREKHGLDMARAQADIAPRFAVDGPVASAVDLPVGGGTWAACYSRAPIGVLSFIRPGTSTRAYTVAACGDLGPQAAQFIAAFHREIGEPGWAGTGGITGSRQPTMRTLAEVVAAAKRAAASVGIVGARSEVAAQPRLR
jgi:hypothetical protein